MTLSPTDTRPPTDAGTVRPAWPARDHVIEVVETTTYRLTVRAASPVVACAALRADLETGALDLRDHTSVHAEEDFRCVSTRPVTEDAEAPDVSTDGDPWPTDGDPWPTDDDPW